MFQRLLHLNPRATRCFIVALALLQMVAPTWHICALGGHAKHHQNAAHHGALASALATAINSASDAAPNQPLICFCAPHQKPLPADTPKLDGFSPENHATCLAMLLQTMPGQIAAPPAFFRVEALVEIVAQAEFHAAPTFAAPRRFLGRAPPWKC